MLSGRRGIGFGLLALGLCLVMWLLFADKDVSPAPAAAERLDVGKSTPETRRIERDVSAEAEGPLTDDVIHRWLGRASRDPAAVLDEVLALEDAEERLELLEWILAAWTSDDREPALEWLVEKANKLPEDRLAEVLDLLIGNWAAEDPLAAMEWVERRLDPGTGLPALETIAAAWGLADPQGLEKWILAQNAPGGFWVEELIDGLTQEDPGKAMEWCGRLAHPENAEAFRQSVIQSWLLTDPEGADAYLRENPSLVPEVVPEAGTD